MQLVSLSTLATALVMGISSVCGKQIELKAGESIEFHDDLPQGAKWGTQFQIVDGTVGFRLAGPDGVIFEGPAETYGSYALTAKTPGVHTFKFTNSDPHGTVSRKISFSVLGSTSEPARKLDPVQSELQELNAGLRVVRDEHSFLMEREIKHRAVAESTNSRVMWWFFIQIIMLGGVCYFQISSLKKFFEVRRLV